MNRFIEIQGELVFKRYDLNSWEIIVDVLPVDLIGLILELQLIDYNHLDSIIINSLKTKLNISISKCTDDKHSQIQLLNSRYHIRLAKNHIEAILSYLLQYFRDAFAPVSHMHIDIYNSNIDGVGTFTIKASVFAEPMSGEEAKKILGI